MSEGRHTRGRHAIGIRTGVVGRQGHAAARHAQCIGRGLIDGLRGLGRGTRDRGHAESGDDQRIVGDTAHQPRHDGDLHLGLWLLLHLLLLGLLVLVGLCGASAHVVPVVHRISGAIAAPELGRVVVAARTEDVAERVPRQVEHTRLVRAFDLADWLFQAHIPVEDGALEVSAHH